MNFCVGHLQMELELELALALALELKLEILHLPYHKIYNH